jgi:hypothetical protein
LPSARPSRCNAIHKVHDILVIAVCAVVCVAEGWIAVTIFGRRKLSWFKTLLDLPGGFPSHDTFGRVFAVLDPDAFDRCFVACAKGVARTSGARPIAIKSKAIRRSFQHAWDKSGMTPLVSAFLDASPMAFSQVAVSDNSNAIEAVPRLPGLLCMEGATVTIDAAGCQTDVARPDRRGRRGLLAGGEGVPAAPPR